MGFFWILVGFVLGLLVAWAFRAFYGLERPRKSAQPCPRCGQRVSTAHERCDWCGLLFRGVLARELGDLQSTKRQMRRFQELGVLDPDLLVVIQQEIATRRRRLLGREKAPAPQVQPLLPFTVAIPVAEAPRTPEKPLTVIPVEAPSSAKPQSAAPVLLNLAKTPIPAPVFV